MTEREVVSYLVKHIKEVNPFAAEQAQLPLDQSLVELGIMDSFGIVELVDHIEKHWQIRIYDSELTRERFGSIEKMAKVILEKIAEKK